jgi:AGZA family xanthine/uracil permease-like MFS transporter
MLDRFFKLGERGTSLRTEVLAGATTFLTMAYIVFVNPGILAAAGVPFAGAATATALGAAVMCITMGLVSNRPLALASGMGLNAVVSFSIIGAQQAHVPWQVGMAAVLLEGLAFVVLVLTGLRESVMNAIPMSLKRATGGGIGLFITFIGLNQGGVIRAAPVTLVTLGDFSQRYLWVTLIGLGAILAFRCLRVKGEILWGLLAATSAALLLGVAHWPTAVLAPMDFSTFWAPFVTVNGMPAVAHMLSPALLTAVFALLLSDFFDTMGTVVAVGEQAGFVDTQGRVPGLQRILLVDASAAAVGGLFGASSITTYVESAAGVAEGGRTGLTVIVTGLLFAVAALFSPVIAMVGGGYRLPNATHYSQFVGSGFHAPPDLLPPVGLGDAFVYPITAGALIFVGFLMMNAIRNIEWDDWEESFPAFLTFVCIPLSYSISNGIGLGFISHTLIKLLRGKARQVHGLMYAVSLAFLVAFVVQARQ